MFDFTETWKSQVRVIEVYIEQVQLEMEALLEYYYPLMKSGDHDDIDEFKRECMETYLDKLIEEPLQNYYDDTEV